MLVRIGRMPGEHATRPTIRTADFDELMREHPGVTAGESIGLGDRRAAGFDGPGFELRSEVRAVEQRDRETRRVLTPIYGVEADGEILPRAQRRTPLPDTELTLARPARSLEKPARTEVMEERKEHYSGDKLARGYVDKGEITN